MATNDATTATTLWRALGTLEPCCPWDLPEVAATVSTVLAAYGYPVVDDIDDTVLSGDQRAEIADRLIAAAAELRTPKEDVTATA